VFTARYVNTTAATLIYIDCASLRNVCRFHFVLRPREQEVQDGSITLTVDRKSELENVSCLRKRGGGLRGCINAFSACFNCPIYLTSISCRSVSCQQCYETLGQDSSLACTAIYLPLPSCAQCSNLRLQFQLLY
jgi:hypothetical protein